MTERELKIKSLLMPLWQFKLYHKWFKLKNKIKLFFEKEYKFQHKWFFFSFSNWKTFSITWREADYDESKAQINISILWLHLYIYTSQKYAKYDKETYDYHQGEREYGIAIHNNNFWIYNGLKQKAFEFPYTYRFIRHSVLRKDGTWEHDLSKIGRKVYKSKQVETSYSKDFWDKKWDNILYKETFDFKYIMKDGTVQKRKATIKLEEREWRRYFLLWTKWKNKINKVIDIEFDKEVGERSGTWKGGVIGTSYKILDDETPEQCLRRFERNKKL